MSVAHLSNFLSFAWVLSYIGEIHCFIVSSRMLSASKPFLQRQIPNHAASLCSKKLLNLVDLYDTKERIMNIAYQKFCWFL